MDKFLNTLYFGDRFLKSVEIDGIRNQVRLQVNLISRVNPSTGRWDYYDKGDTEDGWLVFANVRALKINASSGLPNDEIHVISAKRAADLSNFFDVEIELASVDENSTHTEAKLFLSAADVYLLDPSDLPPNYVPVILPRLRVV
jgi:hypothetical protein